MGSKLDRLTTGVYTASREVEDFVLGQNADNDPQPADLTGSIIIGILITN